MAGKNIYVPEKGFMNVNDILKNIERPYLLDEDGYVARNYMEEVMDTLEDSLDCPRCQMFCYHEIMKNLEVAGQVEQNMRSLATKRNVNQKIFLRELGEYEWLNKNVNDMIDYAVLLEKGAMSCDRV